MKPNPSWLLPPMAVGLAYAAPAVGLTFWPNLQWKTVSSDGFYNYDFDSKSAVATNVDWMFNMIWYHNANINDVKSYLSSRGFTGSGSSQDARVYENGNANPYDWDSDSGKKTGCYVDSTGNFRYRHTRLYAPTDSPYYDYFYDVSTWGYYIIATTHHDINENALCDNGNTYFGYSEDLENYISDLADDNYSVYRDNYPLSNSGYGFYDSPAIKPEPNHYHQSDGYATTVKFS